MPLPSVPQNGIAWERLVAMADPEDLVLHVSALWTRVILEVVAAPSFGRKMLRKDGTILDLPPDGSRGRRVFLNVDRARQLHQQHGLTLFGQAGTAVARFRFAAASAEDGRVTRVLDALATCRASAFL